MCPPVRIGVVTVSDRASRGEYEDKGGPAIVAALTRLLATAWEPAIRLVPDERDQIAAALRVLADDLRCPLIITSRIVAMSFCEPRSCRLQLSS